MSEQQREAGNGERTSRAERETAGAGDEWPRATEDDLRQYMFRQPEDGRLDGAVCWDRAEAVAYAARTGLVVVERRWVYLGERVAWGDSAVRGYERPDD